MSRAPVGRPAADNAAMVDSILEAVVGKLEATVNRLVDIEARLAALDGLDAMGSPRR